MIKALRKIDKKLFICSLIMYIGGLLMIFSASYAKAITSLDNAYYYLIRQSIILIVCFIVFLILINIPTNKYRKNYKLILYLSIGLLFSLYFIGITVNGAKSWISLPYFNFQPSELSKIAIIIYMAYYYERNKNNKDNHIIALKPFIFIVIIFFLIASQPDLGSAIINILLAVLIFLAVPLLPNVKKKVFKYGVYTFIFILLGIIILLLSGKTGLYEYQLQRLNFLNPCQRYTEVGTGYQVCNGYIAINNGGIKGVGIGDSTQKHLYLPEAYTDFIFPILVEELGLIGGVVVIVLYALIISRIINIGRKTYTLSHSLICYSVAVYIFIHIAINLVGVLGLLPLTGVPLPFLSYGGSYTLCLTISLTIVQRINVETQLLKQEERLKNKIREI